MSSWGSQAGPGSGEALACWAGGTSEDFPSQGRGLSSPMRKWTETGPDSRPTHPLYLALRAFPPRWLSLGAMTYDFLMTVAVRSEALLGKAGGGFPPSLLTLSGSLPQPPDLQLVIRVISSTSGPAATFLTGSCCHSRQRTRPPRQELGWIYPGWPPLQSLQFWVICSFIHSFIH